MKYHDPHDLRSLLREIEEEQVLNKEGPDGNYEKPTGLLNIAK
jgi:hypothetical protein